MTGIKRSIMTLAPSLRAAALACLAAAPAQADAVSDFYRSNPIKYYVSTSPGGGYDLVSRIFVRYFPNHMPGKPSIVVINMPGAAGVTLANWTANVAPKDGTMLGMANLTVPMNQVIAPDQVRYDATKLNWVGNLEQAILSLFTWHTSATKTMADARARETIMGVSSKTSVLYQMLALSNKLLGTKFKIILGYEQNRVISIERGELEGSASTVQNYPGIAPRWNLDKDINILTVNADKRLPRFPNAPTMSELTDNPVSKQMLEFMMLQSATARAIFAPPGVPQDRLAALRRAFDETARDPGFIADMKRAQIEVEPSTGEETQAAVGRLIGTSPEVAAMVLDAVK
jgi:tripartite-type tricarboxylate transporter receptor subunit TctC